MDILVNNAGLNLESIVGAGGRLPEKFWDIAPADFRRITEVNAIAPFLLTRAAVGPMLARRWGRIVIVSTSKLVLGVRTNCKNVMVPKARGAP